MAKITNPWVGYLDRSFQQIKTNLLSKLTTSNPELTDHTESNLLVIIISMFAGVAEMLNLYIDNMAREAFIATARRFSSMVKLVRLLDYRIKAATGAQADIQLIFDVPSTGFFGIPVGTEFKSKSGLSFITTQFWGGGFNQNSITVPVWQVNPVLNYAIGTSSGAANQLFAIGTNYVDSSLVVNVNGTAWSRRITFGYSRPYDKHFIVEIDVDGIAYLIFGDGVNGKIPTVTDPIIVSYFETLGEPGNVPVDTITELVSTLNIPGVTTIVCTNPQAASGGSSYETTNRIRTSAPLSIRTLDRAVTRQDYIDVAKLAPGVGKAEVEFDCGKIIKVYIVPINGGIAQSGLLAATLAFINIRKMITTFVNTKPAGLTRIYLEIEVWAKYTQDAVNTKSDVINALVLFGSYANMEINKAIRLSDVIAVVDNLAKVDYLKLNGISTIPYARPLDHTVPLVWTPVTLTTSTVINRWRFKLTNGATLIQVFKNNQFLGFLNFGVLFTDPGGSVKFIVNNGLYLDGYEWEFSTYPYKQDLEIDDYTLPIILSGDCNIKVYTQNTEPI